MMIVRVSTSQVSKLYIAYGDNWDSMFYNMGLMTIMINQTFMLRCLQDLNVTSLIYNY